MIPEVNRREASELVVCTRCKKRLPDDAKYCPYCGRELTPKYRKARRPNGSGSVVRCKDKRALPWRARLTVGTVVYNIGYFATSAEATRAIAMFEVPNGSVVRNRMTLGDVYKIVMDSKESTVSASSIATYRAAWNHLSDLETAPIEDLRPADFQRIIDGMKDSSRSSCEKVRVLVSQIGKWAVANDLLKTNPAQFLTLPKKEKKNPLERETFTQEEIDRLWENGSEDAEIILAMIYTGMRINELFTLSPANVFIGPQYAIPYIVGGEKTAAGRNRQIALHDRLIPIFTRWRDRGGEFLILGQKGGKMDDRKWRENHYFPLLDHLGIKRLNPHKARHTFATLAANAGAEPAVLQKIMGHADFATTSNVYHHADLEAQKKLVNLLK